MSEQPAPEQSSAPTFGEIAAESVHQSVEHEREITVADDLDPTASEPYAPVDELDEDLRARVADQGEDETVAQGLPEDTEEPSPSGERVVNSITAALRR